MSEIIFSLYTSFTCICLGRYLSHVFLKSNIKQIMFVGCLEEPSWYHVPKGDSKEKEVPLWSSQAMGATVPDWERTYEAQEQSFPWASGGLDLLQVSQMMVGVQCKHTGH